jgi:predicted nucleotidyltransferase
MDISPPVATIRAMDFDTLKSIIEAHRDELRELGVRRVRVFGSVARGEATETSDVDLSDGPSVRGPRAVDVLAEARDVIADI